MGSACGKPSAVVSPNAVKRKLSQSELKRSEDEAKAKAAAKAKKKTSEKERDAMLTKSGDISAFSVMNTLGTGSYGAVKLAKHKLTEEMVAIKMTHKNHAAKGASAPHPVESVAWKQLLDVRSNFVVRSYCTFMSEPNICTVMELCEGGDLNIHLELCGNFAQGDAKFYIQEICLGLAALHAKNIIYHDLKPQNMMLSTSGHIKLIDFGLASVGKHGVRNGCHCMCGAPAYMSPEMFAGTGHDEMTDWWAVGITYYEFLTGCRPFGGSTVNDLSKDICQSQVDWDPAIGGAKDFIRALLEKNASDRLGSRGGIEQIKKHSHFSSTKWDDIKNTKRPGPKRTEKAKLKGTGGSNMSRMDSAMMLARGGGNAKKGSRRFTITEEGAPSSSKRPDPSKKGDIGGMDRDKKFAEARARAERRRETS